MSRRRSYKNIRRRGFSAVILDLELHSSSKRGLDLQPSSTSFASAATIGVVEKKILKSQSDRIDRIRSTPCCRLNKRKTKRTRECCFSITSFVTSASSIEFQLDELSPHIMVLVYWHFNAVIQHPPPRISCSLLPSHKTRRTTSSTTYFKRRLSR